MTESKLQSSWLNGLETKNIIVGLMKKTGSAQLEVAHKILDVKTKMDELLKNFEKSDEFKTKGSFEELLKKEYNTFLESLPFGKKVAQKFILIAKDPMINKFIEDAPLAYNTLYDKCKGLTEDTWVFMKDKGLNPFTTANVIMEWKLEYQQKTAKPDVPETTEEEVNDAVDDAKSISSIEKVKNFIGTNFKVDKPTTEEVIDTTSEEVTEETACNTCGEVECVCDEDETISDIETVAFINATPNVSEDKLEVLNILLEEVIAEFVNENGLSSDDVKLSMNPFVLSDNPNYNIEFDVAA